MLRCRSTSAPSLLNLRLIHLLFMARVGSLSAGAREALKGFDFRDCFAQISLCLSSADGQNLKINGNAVFTHSTRWTKPA